MNTFVKISMVIIILVLSATCFAERYYVKPGGNDEADGLSWDTAFASLTKGAETAQTGDEVWVKFGEYKEGVSVNIKQGVSFFGGFTGTETQLEQRDLETSPTIINGEQTFITCVKNSGTFDGFHITEGSESGISNSYGTIANCEVYNNLCVGTGGGIVNYDGFVTHCKVYNNTAFVWASNPPGNSSAGGIYNNSKGTVNHCLVYNNVADIGGGIGNYGKVSNSIIFNNTNQGIYNSGEVINCTVYKNSCVDATDIGGIGGSGTVTNCISWKNQGGDIIGETVEYSCFLEAKEENGNLSANPLFENTSGDIATWDFHLKNGSPCIDSGTIQGAPEHDFEENTRPGGDGKICMGAYESPDNYLPEAPEPRCHIYVKKDGDEQNPGNSWDEALKTISKALLLSSQNDSLYEIWVAQGTYQEGYKITVQKFVWLYGGFAGTETQRDQRDFDIYKTIIDGNNSHGCIVNHGLVDGFYITRGEAYEGAGVFNLGRIVRCSIHDNNCNSKGGGIYTYGGEIDKCRIFQNSASSDGGGIYSVDSTISNCIIYKNSNGIYGAQSAILHCTLYNNSSYGIDNTNPEGTGSLVYNTISWKNSTGDIYCDGEIGYCCYGGAYEINGNIFANPLFVNTSGDISTWDFHLRDGSPSVDSGDAGITSNPDMEGTPRPGGDSKVCMGALESPDTYIPGPPEPPQKRFYIKPSGYDFFDGLSWDTALHTFQGAYNKINETADDSIHEVWIAQGKYYPEMFSDTVVPGRALLYGGFSGSETEMNQRNIDQNRTIIDGDLSYHAISNSGLMDGFFVTGGNPIGIYNWGIVRQCTVYGNNNGYLGGGINNEGTVTQCRIYDNSAYSGGGIYNTGLVTNSLIYDNNTLVSRQDKGEAAGICNHGTMRNCLVYKNTNTAAIGHTGGVENAGLMVNCVVFGNSAISEGGGIRNLHGAIKNCISWNNSNDDIIDFYGDGVIEYNCYSNATGTGNISDDPQFVNTTGDFSTWDFKLKDVSPCIDAGDPDAAYNDRCLPPGKGSERNDMGGYGGPDNCTEYSSMPLIPTPTPIPTPSPSPTPPFEPLVGVITQYGDSWGATCHGFPPFDNPYRMGWLGFQFDPEQNWFPLIGNADGKRLDDLIQITEYGDAWVSITSEINYSGESQRWGWLGFRYDERDGYNGWMPLAGDANGDGTCDLIQVTEYGDAWVALSTETSYGQPSRWGWLGYRFNRGKLGERGAIPLAGDANGDGLCDLIQVTEYGDAWVALSSETTYNQPTRWGWIGFHYSPYDGWYPLCGDVNGDGLDDLIQITPTGYPWVSLSMGSFYLSPTRWRWIGFYYDEAQGYYPLIADVNSDVKDDLIKIGYDGNVWVRTSRGDAFNDAENWGNLGFLFSRENGYLPFFLGY